MRESVARQSRDVPRPRVSQTDIETILVVEEIRQLLEQSEQAGSIRAADLAEIGEAYELTELEHDALLRELDQRGIEILEQPPQSEVVAAITAPVETTTDALQLFLREAGRHQLLTAAQEVELAKAIERGDLVAAPKEGACVWCDYRPVCGPDEETRVARKPPERLQDLAELRRRP